jgi:Flp pilus assembly protein TadG
MRIPAARSESGQALVEFALVAPLVLLLLLGVVQFGIAFNESITVADAARAGSRAAVVAGAANATAAAKSAVVSAAGNLDPSTLSSGTTVTVGATDVTVRVTYPYSIDLLGLVVKNGVLSSSITERLE